MIMITMIKVMLKKDNIKNIKRYKKDETLTGEEKKTIILIYYIQTMKRLPCLICSVSIAFIKTKRGMSLIYGTSTILFALKILPFQHGLLL